MASTTTSPIKSLSGKDSRFFARISSRDKSLIEEAASLLGQSAATFVITQAREAAHRLVDQEKWIRLNREESRKVIESLLAPPQASNKFFNYALQDYRMRVKSDVNPKSSTPPVKRASGNKASRN